MGILEDIQSKLDTILSLVEGGTAPAGTTTTAPAETAAQKKKREAAEAAAKKPAFTAEQLRDKYLEVQKLHGDAPTKALIAEQGHSKLADLIGDTDSWQKAWDAAVAKIAEAPEGDDNGGL